MTQVESIFISDVHLRSRGCKADKLIKFLGKYETKNLFFVGDTFDLWVPNHWNENCNIVVRKVLKKANNGTNVVIVTGNHDDALRFATPISFGNILICDHYEYKGFLIIHGDQFDLVNKWVSHVGGILYDTILILNEIIFNLRTKLGIQSRWSLSHFVKTNSKKAMNFLNSFKHSTTAYAKKGGFKGVITGHVHTPEISMVDGIAYVNCGDWVENCSAVIEHLNGDLELIYAE